jgi:hypothetical protein
MFDGKVFAPPNVLMKSEQIELLVKSELFDLRISNERIKLLIKDHSWK